MSILLFIGSTVLSWHWEREEWTESGDDPCWVNTRGIKAIRAGSSHEQTPRDRIHSTNSQNPHWHPSSQDLGCVLLAPLCPTDSLFFSTRAPWTTFIGHSKRSLPFFFFFFLLFVSWMSKSVGLLGKLSLAYKTNRFPWKKHALVGYDLAGNEYWDCPNPLGKKNKIKIK